MLFSIITVCFNSEKTIRRTFNSVLSQSFTDYEYLVIDGKSTDKTLEIIKEYEPKFNGRMHWISEPDNGIYDAMNKGIRLAKGEIVGIINSDDWYEKNALLQVSEKVNEKSGDIYYGALRFHYSEDITEIRRTPPNFMSLLMPMQHPSCFIANSLYKCLGGYKTKYKIAADYEFLLHAYLENAVFIPIDHVLSNFTMNGISSTRDNEALLETVLICRQYEQISLLKTIRFVCKICIEICLKLLKNKKTYK